MQEELTPLKKEAFPIPNRLICFMYIHILINYF